MSFDEMFNTKTKDLPREKLPTIAQYLKSNKPAKSRYIHVVELIWLPGKFNNFTLQTGAFRIIIAPKHPMYGHLRNFCNAGNESTEIGFCVEITDWQEGSFMLVPHDRDGNWTDIGESGIRWHEP